MSLSLSSCATRGYDVLTPASYAKPRKSGFLTVALRGASGYISHASTEVNHKFQIHLFLRNKFLDPGFYVLEGSVDGVPAGRSFFDYNGFGWFQIIEIRLPLETYWHHAAYRPTESGGYEMFRTPVRVSFAVLGPIPKTQQHAYGEVFIWLGCKACQV